MIGVPLHHWLSMAQLHWLQFALTTPVVLWAGWPLLTRGWQSIVSGHLNMFTLILMGVGAAFLYSAIATIMPSIVPEAFKEHGDAPIYFEAAAVIVALVLLGTSSGTSRATANRRRHPRVVIAHSAHGTTNPKRPGTRGSAGRRTHGRSAQSSPGRTDSSGRSNRFRPQFRRRIDADRRTAARREASRETL